MPEEPPKPINQEDVQALEELKREAIANGNFEEQAEAFAHQAESIGVDPAQRYATADAENLGSSGEIRPTTTEDVQGAIAEYNDTSSEMSEVGPAAVASVAQEPWTIDKTSEGSASNDSEQPSNAPNNPEATNPDDDLYEEYSKAVRDESETFSVKDSETGEFVQKKAKDLNFREWLSASEKKKAAKWYTQTRPHGEASDELDIDHPSEDDIQRTLDKDHQERLNAQEGKTNPTEDDVEYYRWLKGNGGHEDGSETVSDPEGEDPNRKIDEYDESWNRKPGKNDGSGTVRDPGDEESEVDRDSAGKDLNRRIGDYDESWNRKSVENDEFWDRTPENDTDLLPEIVKSPELLELEAQLEIARSEYARMRAGKESATFYSFKYNKAKVEEAAQKYEEIKARAEAKAIELLRSNGLDEETIESSANFGRFVEESKLVIEQYGFEMQRIEKQRPQTRKFFEWWNKQSGKLLSKGTLKKAGVMAVIGAPVGMLVGTVAAPLIGGGVAGLAGVASLRAISKGILGYRINKGASGFNLAAEKASSRIEHLKEITDRLEAHNEELTAEMVDTLNRRLTDSAKKGNDKEALKALLVAGTAGALGAWLVGSLFGGPTAEPPGPPKPNFSLDDFKRGIYKGVVQQGPEAQHTADIAIDQLTQHGVQPSASFNQLANQVVELGSHGTTRESLEGIAKFLGRSVGPSSTLQPEQLLSAGGVNIIKRGLEAGLSDDAIRQQIIDKLSGTVM